MKYKYYLKWSGHKDTPVARAVFDFLQTYRLMDDSKARLIDYKEYMKLVEAGEISEPKSYWSISEGEIGLIVETHWMKYKKTWESIDIARGDFIKGWYACEKYSKGLK